MKPFETSIPKNSLIDDALDQVDYSDVFSVRVPAQYAITPERVVILFFQSFPTWAKILLGLREFLGKWVGLKTAHGLDVGQQIKRFTGSPGQSIALFHVKDRTAEEILTGEEDKHLDFCLSFIGSPKKDHFEMTLATSVKIHGRLGQFYFFFVKPVHRILVPVMLRRMAKQLLTMPLEPSFK